VNQTTADSFDEILSGQGKTPSGSDVPQGLYRTPDIEIIEETDALVVQADLVGVEREDIRVDVSPQRIVIAATARDAILHKPSGVYQKSVTLPAEVRPEDAEAHYNNGVLEVFLPKRQGGHTGVFHV